MTHHIHEQATDVEDDRDGERTRTDGDSTADEAELKITVRKLEMPVRPRGVLAE